MEQNESTPAIVIERVSKQFKAGARTVTALNDVSAQVAKGSITGLIGPDGAGKTTMMRLIAGLLSLDSGRIEVLGLDVSKQPLQIQARVGYMPQHFGLYEDLSVQENLDLYADLQDVEPAMRSQRYTELLHMTGLAPFTDRLAGKLSGGMKQKLGLACTLVRVPDLLLLDEPTVGVDPVSRRELWGIIDRVMKSDGMSVLLSTAYLDEAERCSCVLLMHEGRLIGDGPPASFTERMRGRSFRVSAHNRNKRQLQKQLSETPGVLDAIIQGAHVRIVLNQTPEPADAILPPDIQDIEIQPIPPRFEDSFVALLKERLAEDHKEDGAGSALASTTSDFSVYPENSGQAPQDCILIEHLVRRFGAFTAVDDVSFTVQRGEVFGLLGANGAGKSTTFRMLCGLLPPTSGKLRVAGFDLRTAAASARERIGYMAQKFSLYGDLSVRENLQFFSSAYGLSGARQRERIAWALVEFELHPFTQTTSKDLPLGFKQRLALACALMHEPEIIFLDEPTSGVDPLARRDFWRRINGLAETGVTVLVTTHFMEEAEYCDRLVIMARGRLLAEGESVTIKAKFQTAECPDPTMEDAFIALIEQDEAAAKEAAAKEVRANAA